MATQVHSHTITPGVAVDARASAGDQRLSIRVADVLAWATAALAALASAAGLAVAGLYRDAPFWVHQARGTDLATLLLAVPVLIIGLWSARQGSVAGRLAIVGALLYLVYNYAIFAFSVAMNPLSVVYIALLGMSVWSLALIVRAIEPDALSDLTFERLPRRLSAGVLIAVTAMFGLLWLGQIASATLTGQLPPDLVRADLPTNPVYALDLGLFLPLCGIAAVGLLRGIRSAAMFTVPALLWLAFTSAGIVAAFWFTASAGELVPLPVVILVGAIGVLTAALAAASLVRGSRVGSL